MNDHGRHKRQKCLHRHSYEGYMANKVAQLKTALRTIVNNVVYKT